MTGAQLLAFAGGHEEAVPGKIDGFRKFVLLWSAVRSWLWLRYGAEMEGLLLLPCAVGLTVAAVLAWWPRQAHRAVRLALAFLLWELLAVFPFADNHFALEVLTVCVLAVVGRGGEGETEALRGLLWVTAIVLFYTGLQKVSYGLYFRGEFLAFMVGRGDRFGDVFAWILPAGEVARLAAIDPMRSGAGPFLVDSIPFVAASNLVWIAEMVLAPLLLWRPTRRWATWLALVLILWIELGAREIGFALLFGNLLLLFLARDHVRRLVPVCAALLLWALLASLGVLPGGDWIEAGYL